MSEYSLQQAIICSGHKYLIFSVFLSDIQREQDKVKRSIKDAAKKGHKDVCVILAKEMIQSKRAVTKLYASKAHMNSVVMSMRNQLGEFSCWVVGEGKSS